MPTEYYKAQLERGLIYQDFVYEILHRFGISTVAYGSKLFQQKLGENKAKIEIKFDDRRKQTGNLYIETQEKSDPKNVNYVMSGIYRDCVEYVIGDYDVIYRLPVSTLRIMFQSGKYPEIEIGLKSSKGFLLAESSASKWAICVYRVECSRQVQELLEADRLNAKTAAREMSQLLMAMKCSFQQERLFED